MVDALAEAPQPVVKKEVALPKPEQQKPQKIVNPEEINAIVGEINQARQNAPKAKQLEQTMQGTPSSEQSSRHAFKELAEGNVFRMTKLDRFIYQAVEQANGDITRAMNSLSEQVASGTLYGIEYTHMYESDTKRLEKVCKVADVDYQEVQGRAQEYATQLGENISPDQILALQVLAFRDALATRVADQEYVTKAHTNIDSRIKNKETQLRYRSLTKALTGEEKDLTIENVIEGIPKNVESAGKKVEEATKSLETKVEQAYANGPIVIDGTKISFEEIAQYSEDELVEAILTVSQDEDQSNFLQAQLGKFQGFYDEGSRQLANTPKSNNQAYSQLIGQQVALVKLVGAYARALEENSANEFSLAA